jgi:hypothetical protein
VCHAVRTRWVAIPDRPGAFPDTGIEPGHPIALNPRSPAGRWVEATGETHLVAADHTAAGKTLAHDPATSLVVFGAGPRGSHAAFDGVPGNCRKDVLSVGQVRAKAGEMKKRNAAAMG